ncbi:MAG: T9SS type A sorting domain-containing protein [Bacteroidetes bacterium]|nr:T9SS type A sorting domain-containing protein [Bacteroidota bacterium]
MNLTKQIISAIAAIFAAIAVSFAQSYSIVPNDTVRITGVMEDLQTLSIQQINISIDTITLKWKKISENVPSKWEASVCDNSFCHTSLVDSGTMTPIIPNEYGLLLLHITPHVEFGTANVRYAVWDSNSPSVKDTLTYILTSVETLGIKEIENTSNFNIFPNPVNSNNFAIFADIQKGSSFSIIDIEGKVIQSGIFEGNSKSFSVENFPNSIYFISVFDQKKCLGTKKFAIQH